MAPQTATSSDPARKCCARTRKYCVYASTFRHVTLWAPTAHRQPNRSVTADRNPASKVHRVKSGDNEHTWPLVVGPLRPLHGEPKSVCPSRAVGWLRAGRTPVPGLTAVFRRRWWAFTPFSETSTCWPFAQGDGRMASRRGASSSLDVRSGQSDTLLSTVQIVRFILGFGGLCSRVYSTAWPRRCHCRIARWRCTRCE